MHYLITFVMQEVERDDHGHLRRHDPKEVCWLERDHPALFMLKRRQAVMLLEVGKPEPGRAIDCLVIRNVVEVADRDVADGLKMVLG